MKVNVNGKWSNELINKAEIAFRDVAEFRKFKKKEKQEHQKKEDEEKIVREQKEKMRNGLHLKEKQYFDLAHLFRSRMY